MNALHEEFKGRGFTLLLLNMGENPDLVRRTVKARGYRRVLTRLRGAPSDYAAVMRLKYTTSALFVTFSVVRLIVGYSSRPAWLVR